MPSLSSLRFSDEHGWVRADPDGAGAVGITPFGQEQLGEIVFVALPPAGRHLNKGDEAAVLESVKAAIAFRSPLSGTVIEVNGPLESEPRKVNEDPTGEGWLFRLRLDEPGELEELMDEETYEKRTAGKGG